MEWRAGNILDQGTLCTEMLRLELLRGQLVSQLSLKDAMAWQPVGLTLCLPGHARICFLSRWSVSAAVGLSFALSPASGPLPSGEVPPWV